MAYLRPHPLRHHPRRTRHPLHELRRLGRKLHALVEHEDGRFEIITWADPERRVAPVPASPRARMTHIWSRPMRGIPRSTGMRTLTMMARPQKILASISAS